MADVVIVIWVIALAFALGLSPALLPAKVSTRRCWCLALLILLVSLAIEWSLRFVPHPFHHIALMPLWFAQAISVPVLAFRPFRD
jgi:hypothetical protein